MSDDERRPRIHVHTGGLIILIIVLLILFKVDLPSKIKSAQFQENIKFIQTQTTQFWNDYIVFPMKSKTGEWLANTANKTIDNGVSKVENQITNTFTTSNEIDKLNK